MMNMNERIELVGGPHDGKTITLPVVMAYPFIGKHDSVQIDQIIEETRTGRFLVEYVRTNKKTMYGSLTIFQFEAYHKFSRQ